MPIAQTEIRGTSTYEIMALLLFRLYQSRIKYALQ